MNHRPLSSLEKKLSYLFKNKDLLRQALTHKSYVNETKDKTRKDNERFEFLGDAVLDLIICQDLLERFPESSEGDLSKMKAKIVSEETLAKLARGMNLGGLLFLGKGEIQTAGNEKPSLLSDALEALIAAIYLDTENQDNGFFKARQVILNIFKLPLNELTEGETLFDYKTALQEYSQKVFGALPGYTLIQEIGPDHEKSFEIKVGLLDNTSGIGSGKSKKSAEQKAAQSVLLALGLLG